MDTSTRALTPMIRFRFGIRIDTGTSSAASLTEGCSGSRCGPLRCGIQVDTANVRSPPTRRPSTWQTSISWSESHPPFASPTAPPGGGATVPTEVEWLTNTTALVTDNSRGAGKGENNGLRSHAHVARMWTQRGIIARGSLPFSCIQRKTLGQVTGKRRQAEPVSGGWCLRPHRLRPDRIAGGAHRAEKCTDTERRRPHAEQTIQGFHPHISRARRFLAVSSWRTRGYPGERFCGNWALPSGRMSRCHSNRACACWQGQGKKTPAPRVVQTTTR
jgi:hypothetical protein